MHYSQAKATFQKEQRELILEEWTPRPLFFSTSLNIYAKYEKIP